MEVERFWMQIRRASSKTRFSENLHFHLGFPSKGQRGPTPHQNPYVLWKKLTLCKVSGFYEETSRKTDKINKTSSGTKEQYCKRGGWDGLPGLSILSVSGNLPVSSWVPHSSPCTKDAAKLPTKAGGPECTRKHSTLVSADRFSCQKP